ncbi:MAG: helix-turn-helix domain-containing protein [Candidatus Methylomirabilota bacterium]
MRWQPEDERRWAVARIDAGDPVTAVAAALGRSRTWVYRWVARAHGAEATWPEDRSHRPTHQAGLTPAEVVEAVTLVRLSLYNQGLLCGAQNIRWELAELSVTPLPSVRTINRILARAELTHRRTGRYVPKGTPYPALAAPTANAVHQVDYVGPCYLRGPVRFWSLNTVDLATARCALEPVQSRAGQATVDALWASWHRLGLPAHVQVDNEGVFYGSPTHPRGMGLLIRLCLGQGIEPWFIPVREPWRNGVVEKFNDHYGSKFLARIDVPDAAALGPAHRAFEATHNSRYRYSKLGGQTPLTALQRAGQALRFPPVAEAPRVPLPKPETGCYHLVRFIRSDQHLDVFGERFRLPAAAEYAYVVATVDVAQQQLRVMLGADLVAEFPYRLR